MWCIFPVANAGEPFMLAVWWAHSEPLLSLYISTTTSGLFIFTCAYCPFASSLEKYLFQFCVLFFN